MPTSKRTLYMNADRTRLVDETDDGALLLAREGAFISAEDAKQFGVSTDEAEVYDAVAEHERLHGGETDEDAKARRKAMFNKAKPAPENKGA